MTAGDPTNVMDVTEAAYRAGYQAAERDLAQARAEAARYRAALAQMAAGLQSYHNECQHGSGCYCQRLLIPARAALEPSQ